jgi:hypothetical protein
VIAEFRRGSGKQQLSTVGTGARADIQHPVSGFNHLRIMFDNDYRATGIPQGFQSGQQSSGVAGMQSGSRFIKHVVGAVQFCGQRSGQPGALVFASRQSDGRSVQCEVTDTNVLKALQSVEEIRESPGRGKSRFGVEQVWLFDLCQPVPAGVCRCRDILTCEFRKSHSEESNATGEWLKPAATTLLTRTPTEH